MADRVELDARLQVVGHVRSSLTDPAVAPKQGDEGAPEAWLEFLPEVAPLDVRVPEAGVSSTRSADRPNPIGLHPVDVVAIDGVRVRVGGLEAVDGTPVLDVKPQL